MGDVDELVIAKTALSSLHTKKGRALLFRVRLNRMSTEVMHMAEDIHTEALGNATD